MEIPTPSGGLTGLLAAAAAAAVVGFLRLRQWLRKDGVDGVADGAAMRMIKMLQTEIDRRDIRETTLLREVAQLRKQVADLTSEVVALRAQLKHK
jgi:hypothetical protein